MSNSESADSLWLVVTAASGKRYIGVQEKLVMENYHVAKLILSPCFEVCVTTGLTPQGLVRQCSIVPIDICCEESSMTLYHPSEVTDCSTDITPTDWRSYKEGLDHCLKEMQKQRAQKSGISIATSVPGKDSLTLVKH